MKTPTVRRCLNGLPGALLEGAPSDKLVSESKAAPAGVVLAYRDEQGIWQHVSFLEAGAIIHRVTTVFVE